MTDNNRILTPHNAVFFQSGDCPGMIVKEKINAHLRIEMRYSRVYLRRSFPTEEPGRYISVANKEEKEIGMVMDVDTFPKAQREILHAELAHRYFMPTILSIDSLTDRFGHTVFQVKTNIGPIRFTVRDVYRNLFRLPDGKIILTDVDQNRYEIPDPKALDAKSYKRIELYI